jgi:hypothetical protein
MESNFQIGKMDDQTPPEQTQLTARFLVPVMITRKFVITEVKVEDAYCNDMRCDGCGNDMGSQNPKGFFKTFDRWFKLCNKCCREQGFIK